MNEIEDNHLKSIAYDTTNLSGITSFDKNFDPISMNNSFEAEKFEPEPTFEKTLNEIKADHLKSITSIYMNVSAITPKKPSSYPEHLKPDPMSWITLQSPEKSPQFTNKFCSMYHNGNTQLQIRKWWVPLRSVLYLLSFRSDLCK